MANAGVLAAKGSIKLTKEQSDQIHKIFGQQVHELPFAVEEFTLNGKEDSKMVVLKIDNVAKVQIAALGDGMTAN